jgi:predicted type IV restriction endonuclease/predicted transport protein
MDKLARLIDDLLQRLPNLRSHSLKETPTRTIVIDPILEALGWDVRNPDEVQLEYPTIDGKFVDYALKIGGRTVLLVEAKALDDTLDDVKSVTQVVGYAANDGIVWCVLTNGIKWRVYRSIEECPAPKKLLYEICLDPMAPERISKGQIVEKLWLLSREEMDKGTLDIKGEQIFIDNKIIGVLYEIISNPPRQFIKFIRSAASEINISPQSIRESLIRISRKSPIVAISGEVGSSTYVSHSQDISEETPTNAAQKAWETRRSRHGKPSYDEGHHLGGISNEVISLYRELDRFCLSLDTNNNSKIYLAKSINFVKRKYCFCSVHVIKGGLRVWLKLKYNQINYPPPYARDVANIGHWGVGDVELKISRMSELEDAKRLIRDSFERAR